MRADDFGLGLILAEERAEAPEPEAVIPARREHVVISRADFTTDGAFQFNEPGTRLEDVRGPGTLVEAWVAAAASDYDVYFAVDGQVVVDASFETLQRRSGELSRIAAYQRGTDNHYVFLAEDYEFQRSVDVVIQPNASITFREQRAEVDVVRGD